MFQKATKTAARARVALIGPSGSGKTYTALTIAREIGGKIALIDTEHGSASKYADEFDFDTAALDLFDPRRYIEAIQAADQAGYDVLIIDSLSHAWSGVGGALELVDKARARSQSNNSFTAWKDVTPLHNKLVETILASRCHVIATMRAKTEYVIEADSRGKQAPRKVGMAPVQRDGIEYEFDVVADLDLDHRFIVSKTRCKVLDGGAIPFAEGVGSTIKTWVSDGAPVPPKQKTANAKQIDHLKQQLRALRDIERDCMSDPPEYILNGKWSISDQIASLSTEVVNSRARIAQFLGLPKDEEIDMSDDELRDGAIAQAARTTLQQAASEG